MRVLSVDFGTSNTVAALAIRGQAPRTVTFDTSPLLPSAVFVAADGSVTVGREAQRQARLDPARYEPNPKRRIDDGDVLLGDRVVAVRDLIASVVRAVAVEVRRQLGGHRPDQVRLTYPAEWGSTRQQILQDAARDAGLGGQLVLIPEPVAAAAQYTELPGRQLPEGGTVAVYDLGGGTFDIALVGRSAGGFRVLATGGLADLGGLDFDQDVLDHVGRVASVADPGRWQEILRPIDAASRRAARALAEDVRAAKETLSRYPQTDVALPDPFTDAHLTRTEFEALIRPKVLRSIEVFQATLRQAGVQPAALSGIFLVGGSSRIPLVAKLIAEQLGIVPVALDQPETAVVLGALLVPVTAPGVGSIGPRSAPHPIAGQLPRTRSVANPMSGAHPVAPQPAPGLVGAAGSVGAGSVGAGSVGAGSVGAPAPSPGSGPAPGPGSGPAGPASGPLPAAGPAPAQPPTPASAQPPAPAPAQPPASAPRQPPASVSAQPPASRAVSRPTPAGPPRQRRRSTTIIVISAVLALLVAAGAILLIMRPWAPAATGPGGPVREPVVASATSYGPGGVLTGGEYTFLGVGADQLQGCQNATGTVRLPTQFIVDRAVTCQLPGPVNMPDVTMTVITAESPSIAGSFLDHLKANRNLSGDMPNELAKDADGTYSGANNSILGRWVRVYGFQEWGSEQVQMFAWTRTGAPYVGLIVSRDYRQLAAMKTFAERYLQP